MVRALVLMTLAPGAGLGDALAALAGDLGAGAVGAAVTAGVGPGDVKVRFERAPP